MAKHVKNVTLKKTFFSEKKNEIKQINSTNVNFIKNVCFCVCVNLSIYSVIRFCNCWLISAESMSALTFAPDSTPDVFGVDIGRAHTFL